MCYYQVVVQVEKWDFLIPSDSFGLDMQASLASYKSDRSSRNLFSFASTLNLKSLWSDWEIKIESGKFSISWTYGDECRTISDDLEKLTNLNLRNKNKKNVETDNFDICVPSKSSWANSSTSRFDHLLCH